VTGSSGGIRSGRNLGENIPGSDVSPCALSRRSTRDEIETPPESSGHGGRLGLNVAGLGCVKAQPVSQRTDCGVFEAKLKRPIMNLARSESSILAGFFFC